MSAPAEAAAPLPEIEVPLPDAPAAVTEDDIAGGEDKPAKKPAKKAAKKKAPKQAGSQA